MLQTKGVAKMKKKTYEKQINVLTYLQDICNSACSLYPLSTHSIMVIVATITIKLGIVMVTGVGG